jgi:hypothetical protein
MSSEDDTPTEVPIVCPECGTETRIPLDDVADVLQRHNEQLHDGEEIAEVDPAVRAHLTDMVARGLGLVDDED